MIALGEDLAVLDQQESGHALMRQEIALAKAEVREEAVKAARAGGMLGAAGFAGYMVLLFASIAAWFFRRCSARVASFAVTSAVRRRA